MSTHTPGPWIVNAEQVFGNGHKIATVNQHTSNWLEDRALIAAAPDLLAACKAIVGVFEGHDDVPLYVSKARAAIAMTEGHHG